MSESSKTHTMGNEYTHGTLVPEMKSIVTITKKKYTKYLER